MNIRSVNLKTSLGHVLGGIGTDAHIVELVQFSRAIVQAYMEHFRPSAQLLCCKQGLTIDELAYDCIAEAFVRDSAGKYNSLERFAHSFGRSLHDLPDLDLFLAYKAFLTRIAEQQLAELFCLSDPTGAKIHRNIKEAIKCSRKVELRKESRGLVMRPKVKDALDCLPAFPPAELERAFYSKADGLRTTRALLDVVIGILLEQSTYRRSMPIADITMMFKTLSGRHLEHEEESVIFPSEGLTQSELERIRWEVERAVKQKILLTYVSREKLRPKETEAVVHAFHDLLSDWVTSNAKTDGLYSYLKRHLTVDRETYDREYRSKMEYLLKTARDELSARLMKEL